jgi:hypothetical protein
MVANNARFPVPARMCVAPSMDAASPTVATGQPCRATTFAEWRTKAFPRTIWIVRVPLTAGHEKNPGLWIFLRLDGGRFRFLRLADAEWDIWANCPAAVAGCWPKRSRNCSTTKPAAAK